MAISQTKQAQLTTPEAVYDQPLAPRPNGTNSGKNGLSAGAITGMAVGGVVVCALSFVVGMQVGGSQNSGVNSQAGGPPGMSRSQNSQHRVILGAIERFIGVLLHASIRILRKNIFHIVSSLRSGQIRSHWLF